MKPNTWNWEIYKGQSFNKTFTLSKDNKPFPTGTGVGIRSQIRTRYGELFEEYTSDDGEWVVSPDGTKYTFALNVSAETISALETKDDLVYNIEVYNADGYVCIPFQGLVMIYDRIYAEGE